MTSALVVRDVSKVFGKEPSTIRALRDVTLHVSHQEIVAVLGNNGAGKSTLMSICAGLIPPDEGDVHVEGDLVKCGAKGGSRRLGLAPQEESLYPTLTVRQNLEYFGRIAGLRKGVLEEKVQEVASSLLITEFLERRASTLSGGQRRRLHTALALMHSPTVLLLDEPTVGVDIGARTELLSFVRGAAARGAAVLYSTHQLHEVEPLGARVVLIDHGRILASGSVDELVTQHSPRTAELLFDCEDVGVSADSFPMVEEAGRWELGGYRLVLRVDSPSVRIGEIVDRLSDSDRSSLVSAAIVAPSLEQAYLRLTGSSRVDVEAFSADVNRGEVFE